MTEALQPLLVAGGAVAMLLTLVLYFRMSAFLALIITSLLAAVSAGMPVMQAIASVQNGMGGTLGFIAIVVGLGSMFGALLQTGGGVEALADLFVSRARPGLAPWLLGLLGLVVAIPVFFDVALIILAPIVFGLAKRLGVTTVSLAIPLLAGLATAHAFVPPTPGPIAVADLLNADIGLVALYGALAGAPAMLVAGPLWARFMGRMTLTSGTSALVSVEASADANLYSAPAANTGLILLVIALPLILIVGSTLSPYFLDAGPVMNFLQFIGHPFSALLLSCGAAYFLFRSDDPAAKARLRTACERALEPAGAIILVTGAGGAFKQVLIDTGAGNTLAETVLAFGFTPLVAGFLLALLVRVAQGSATVAMITAAGLTAPILSVTSVSDSSVALTVVAIAAGATAASHVNDSGFWLVSRYFALDTASTLKSWTVASSLVGLTGFAATLILSLFV